jgi:uncharacterized cupredoxin-like copper-binding protein
MAGAAACAPAAAGAVPIAATLYDNAIVLDAGSAPSGRVAFEILNRGELLHEVEIFSGARSGQTLPVRSSIADTTGLTLVDEVENILADSAADLVVDLDPGTYLVICNMPAHYEAGMWTYLTIEDTLD